MTLLFCWEYPVLLQPISASATKSLKPSSITSLFATKPLTIAKKQKPPVIVIDANEGPDEAVVVAENAGTNKDNLFVDVVFVTDGEGFLVSLLVAANPDDVT